MMLEMDVKAVNMDNNDRPKGVYGGRLQGWGGEMKKKVSAAACLKGEESGDEESLKPNPNPLSIFFLNLLFSNFLLNS